MKKLQISIVMILAVLVCSPKLYGINDFLLGDVNQDGTVNLLDVSPFVDRISNGEYQQEADTNLDGHVNLLDIEPFVDLLNNPSAPLPHLQDFELEFLSGALQNDLNIEAPAGGTFIYSNTPALFQVSTQLDPAELGPVTVHAVSANFGFPMEILQQPIDFIDGASQPIVLPPTPFGSSTYLFLTRDQNCEIPLLYTRTEAGPMALAESVSNDVRQDRSLGLTVDQSDLDFDLDPGEDGAINDPPEELPGIQPDSQVSGAVCTSDVYSAQIFDEDGNPAAYQLLCFTVEDPNVVGLRRSGFTNEDPQPTIQVMTNANGFVTFRVEYLGVGSSGMTMVSKPVEDAEPVPAPGPTGEAVNFIGLEPVNELPVIKSIRVTKCFPDAADDEENVPINEGTSEDSPILVYGQKYEIQAELSGPLPDDVEVWWCIQEAGEVVQLIDANGKICVTTGDPNPNTAGDLANIKIEAKLVRLTTTGPMPLGSSEEFDVTMAEKKTIEICPMHYGEDVPSPLRWAQIVKTINEIYNGTGVCFSLGDITEGGEEAKELCICSNASDETEGKTSVLTIGGELEECVCDNEDLHGASDKITFHVGVDIKIKGGNNRANCRGGYNGYALGAAMVACDLGIGMDYDVNGKWASAGLIAPGRLDIAQGERTIAHEAAHLLGLPHVGDNEDDNLLHRFGEGDDPGSKRKLNADQTATIYKAACDLLD